MYIINKTNYIVTVCNIVDNSTIINSIQMVHNTNNYFIRVEYRD